MDALMVVALIAALAGCLIYTVPHLRDRARAQRERQESCEHTWVYFNAMNDPSFPVRHCKWCQKQEHLTRCMTCGRKIDRTTLKEVDVDG